MEASAQGERTDPRGRVGCRHRGAGRGAAAGPLPGRGPTLLLIPGARAVTVLAVPPWRWQSPSPDPQP